ncbi:MAG: cysteine--tRNA ligase [Candidatus Enteromonas sp.]|nr:cysteine--tRNA ligase [Candidatus Enteromonas sp.]
MKAIFFDLDGTLLDTLHDIRDAINDALAEIGVHLSYTYEECKRLIGNGAEMLMHRALGECDCPDSFERLRKAFYPRYLAYQGRNTVPYPSVVETLRELHKNGFGIFVITNKPNQMAQDIIDKTLPRDLFLGVYGHEEGAPVKPDPFLLKKASDEFSIDLAQSYFVGDSVVDLETAKNANIPCIICGYGYGDYSQEWANQATFVVKDFSEILKKGLFGLSNKDSYNKNMRKVTLFNSMGNKMQVFSPINPNKVTMYVCGPTVYNSPHIGNMRPVIVFDTWRRLFQAIGYQVTFVSNYTDVDDKIIQRALELGVSEQELTTSVITEFVRLVKETGSLVPDFTPTPTIYMPKLISYIQDLVSTGYAYEAGGDVYFRVGKIGNYGCLSGNTPDSLVSGARIEVNSLKESPLDFALWKKTDIGIQWSTPWSNGRPGWHTECCAMISSLFPETHGLIDIHGGGFDLKFPHHENEIAQAEAHDHHHLANYWLHNGFINIGDQKMSKSIGNVQLAKDVIRTYGGFALRLMMLNTHYRAPLAFTSETMAEAVKNEKKIVSTVKSVAITLQRNGVDLASLQGSGEEAFFDELCNDLNTPNAITILYGELKNANQLLRVREIQIEALSNSFAKIRDYLKVLGLEVTYPVLTEEDKSLYALYQQAKDRKDFAESDRIRAQLLEKGII